MTSQQILQSDLLDILFENRNKQYGAYQLRKTYSHEMIKAIAITVSSAFLLVLLIRPSTASLAITDQEPRVVVVDRVLLPEEKKPEPPKQSEPPRTEQVKQQAFVDKIIITNKEVIDPLPPQDLLEHSGISNVTTTGSEVGAFQPSVAVPAETKSESSAPAKEAPEEVIPDKQPQFPGGMQAWITFLQTHLQAPEDMAPGEKRTVQVRFHVAGDGSIARFQVLQSAGAAFDNEVIRVLKKMPRWTPAVKAGQPVSVGFTQPVTFVGPEE